MTSNLRPIAFFLFFGDYHNRPLCNPQHVLQCMVYERPLTLDACSLLADVLILLFIRWSWNFSTIVFIHPKLCSRLSTASLEKLMYVNTNMGMFYDYSNNYS